MFASAYIVPYKELGTLPWAPPVPLELGSSYAILAGGDNLPGSTGEGGPYRFGADIQSATHRNWCPFSWDVSGTAQVKIVFEGGANKPGPVDGGTIITPSLVQVNHTFEWEADGFAPTQIRPDFSQPFPPRRMINWNGGSDGFHPVTKEFPVTDLYTVFRDENGANDTAFQFVATARVFATLEPYTWERDGQYWCEQVIRVDISGFYSPDIPQGWTISPANGPAVISNGGSSRLNLISTVVGIARITDSTGLDPNSSWGSTTLYAQGDVTGTEIDITLHVTSNYLDRPDF